MMRASPTRFQAEPPGLVDFERRERREKDRDHEFYSMSEHFVHQNKPVSSRSNYDPSYAVIESVADNSEFKRASRYPENNGIFDFQIIYPSIHLNIL